MRRGLWPSSTSSEDSESAGRDLDSSTKLDARPYPFVSNHGADTPSVQPRIEPGQVSDTKPRLEPAPRTVLGWANGLNLRGMGQAIGTDRRESFHAAEPGAFCTIADSRRIRPGEFPPARLAMSAMYASGVPTVEVGPPRPNSASIARGPVVEVRE
jgi:hypothetical protein